MTATLRGSTVIQSPATLTDKKVDSMGVAKPQANSYPTSSALAQSVIKQEAATLGHDAFRPDIYRVTEGLVT